MLSSFLGLIVLGWFAYEEGKNPSDLSKIPLIKANPEPFKVKPKNPGGMKVPHTNKLVYNMISSNKDSKVQVSILPEPEEPVSKEDLAKAPAPFLAKKDNKEPVKKVIKLSEIPKTPSQKLYKKPEEKKVTEEASAIEKAAKISVDVTTDTKTMQVQLGSYRTVKSLELGWVSLQKNFPEILGGLKYMVKTVELGDKGLFYRLLAGPVESEDKARKICRELTKKKQGCLVAR